LVEKKKWRVDFGENEGKMVEWFVRVNDGLLVVEGRDACGKGVQLLCFAFTTTNSAILRPVVVRNLEICVVGNVK